LQGISGTQMLVGDQAGYAYAISTQTGAITWRGNGGGAIGTVIQAPLGVQLWQFADPAKPAGVAFRAMNSPPNTSSNRDLVFVATRDSGTGNRVMALDGRNGNQVWTYSPGNMDIVVGGMMVDYDSNRLYVPTHAGGSGKSLRVISTLNGGEVASFALGDIDHAVNRDYGVPNQAYVTTAAGNVVAIDVAALTQTWTFSIGKMNAYAFPTNNGFIASLNSGQVQRYSVDPTTKALSTLWATPLTISGPTGIRIDYATQKMYLGDSTGKLHQVDLSTGVDKTLTLSAQGLGTPTIDTSLTPKRLHVGGLDGRLCAVEVPY
jgi:outer membrane protein assembly factor BamB